MFKNSIVVNMFNFLTYYANQNIIFQHNYSILHYSVNFLFNLAEVAATIFHYNHTLYIINFFLIFLLLDIQISLQLKILLHKKRPRTFLNKFTINPSNPDEILIIHLHGYNTQQPYPQITLLVF